MQQTLFNYAAIRREYDRLWESSKEQILTGRVQPDPIPDDTSKRWGITYMARISGPVASTLINLTKELDPLMGPQVLYTAESLHTTIRTLEFYRASIPEDDEQVAHYTRILREIAPHFLPLQIQYRGLTTSPVGVMAQGWPLDDRLYRLRVALHERLEAENQLHGPEIQMTRVTAHSSLSVFSGPIFQPASLVDFIERHRETDLGIATISQIELVRYERTDHEVKVFSLAQI